jgi:hypothetical protein
MRFSVEVGFVSAACMLLGNSNVFGQQPTASSSPGCTCCVSECKQNTRKVYACKQEEYCLRRCCLISFLEGSCGCCDGPCGELRVRHRLMVRRIPAPDTIECVPRKLTCETELRLPQPRPEVKAPAPRAERRLGGPPVEEPPATVVIVVQPIDQTEPPK